MPTRWRTKAETHRPPLHLPRCQVTGKLCLPDVPSAEREIFECRMKFLFHNERRRKETRWYTCEHCGSIHLTAMTDVPPQYAGESPHEGVQMTTRKPDPRRRPIGGARPSRSGSSGSDSSVSFDFGGYDSGSYDSGSSSSSSDSGSSSSSSDSGSSCGGGGE